MSSFSAASAFVFSRSLMNFSIKSLLALHVGWALRVPEASVRPSQLLPSRSLTSMLLPAFKHASTASVPFGPAAHAHSKGVRPIWQTASVSAPALARISTLAWLPINAASISAVRPFTSVAMRSAL